MYQVKPYTFSESERERIHVTGGLGAVEKSARGKTTVCTPESDRDKLSIQVCATRVSAPGPVISSSRDVAKALVGYIGRLNLDMQEHFCVLLLSARREILGFKIIAIGSITHVSVSIADILRPTLIFPTASFIVAHNHPSGDPTPSAEDMALTKRLAEACRILGVRLLDHVIITSTEGKYVSFVDTGLYAPGPGPE